MGVYTYDSWSQSNIWSSWETLAVDIHYVKQPMTNMYKYYYKSDYSKLRFISQFPDTEVK
jgi:hypothetical protein